MNQAQLSEALQQNPEAAEAIRSMVEELLAEDISPEVVDMTIKVIEFALDNPDRYGEVRETLLRDDVIDDEDLPLEFDPVVLSAMLIALRAVQEELVPRFAKGGLARVAAMGRGGDTMLAHVNPYEAAVLRRMGGSGTINPETGLREFGFFKKLKKLVKKVVKKLGPVLPVAMAFIPGMQGLAGTLGSALGATGTAASALGGALMGGGLGALTGGSKGLLTGALMGGIGGGLGDYFGGSAGMANPIEQGWVDPGGFSEMLGSSGAPSVDFGTFGASSSGVGAGEVAPEVLKREMQNFYKPSSSPSLSDLSGQSASSGPSFGSGFAEAGMDAGIDYGAGMAETGAYNPTEIALSGEGNYAPVESITPRAIDNMNTTSTMQDAMLVGRRAMNSPLAKIANQGMGLYRQDQMRNEMEDAMAQRRQQILSRPMMPSIAMAGPQRIYMPQWAGRNTFRGA